MSQQIAHSPQFLMVPVREGNGLGVAGFFIALIGLFIPTGIVALLGLLISLVALGKPPRGFAAMGVVVGLFGTVVWLVLTGAAILGAAAIGIAALIIGTGAFILLQPEVVEITSDMINTTIAVVEYREENARLPDELLVLGLGTSTLADPWGNPYRYELIDEEPGFDLISNGRDGIAGTEDDVYLSEIGEMWVQAVEGFGEKFEEFGKRMEKLEGTHVTFERHHARRHGDHASHYEAEAIAAAVAEAIEDVKAREITIDADADEAPADDEKAPDDQP